MVTDRKEVKVKQRRQEILDFRPRLGSTFTMPEKSLIIHIHTGTT